MSAVLTSLWRRRKWWLLAGVLVLVLGTIGALGQVFGERPGVYRPVSLCHYRGRHAWIAARAAHPSWSTGQLYDATHVCRRTGKWFGP